jgi:hypothetical protein
MNAVNKVKKKKAKMYNTKYPSPTINNNNYNKSINTEAIDIIHLSMFSIHCSPSNDDDTNTYEWVKHE